MRSRDAARTAGREAHLALLTLALAGCTTPPVVETAPPPPRVVERLVTVTTDADRVLEHYARSRHLTGRDAAQALLDARVAFASDPSALNRIRLATLLVLSRDGHEADALQVIDPLLPVGAKVNGDPIHTFALLLKSILDERRRWRESVAQLQGRSREGRSEALAAKAEARALQERISALQQQLEALTDIEKSLAAPKR